MILGMSTATYTSLHVLISLTGIGSGLVVMSGFLTGKRLEGLTAIFLIGTVLTSVSGFGFPFDHLLPSHKVGIISLIVLTLAITARYRFHLAGSWRWIYVIGAATALYLNLFVLVFQAFEKVPALKALAPTQKEPPFLLAHLAVLVVYLAFTFLAAKKFHIEPAPAA
jgi:hypothetical protein